MNNVNSAGAVNAFLKFDNNVITGNYGVFYAGKAKLIFMDNSGQKKGEEIGHNVSPLENFNLKQNKEKKAGIYKVKFPTEVVILQPEFIFNE